MQERKVVSYKENANIYSLVSVATAMAHEHFG